MAQTKHFRCQGCGCKFEYKKRKPKYCGECRGLKASADVMRWRKRQAKPAAGESFQGMRLGMVQLEGQTYEAVGKALGLDPRTVRYLERELLARIRSNPELRELWDTCRSELSTGGEILAGPGLGFSGYVVGTAAKGEFLLKHQAAMGKWHRLHERLVMAECWDEAADVLLEIEAYQRKFLDLMKGI